MFQHLVNTLAVLPPQVVPRVQLDPAYGAELHCSPAVAKALRAADLIRAGRGSISVPLALVATGTNLKYAYLALSLSQDERQLVEMGFESLGGIVQRRRHQVALSAPVTQSAVVELH